MAIEARSAQPLLPLWIFADRNRAGVYLILLCLASVFFGMFFFLTLFTQVVWGYSALRGGLAYLPFIGGFIAIAGICTRLVAPFGARVPMTIGAALAPASMFWLSRVPPTATGACAVPARPYASVWSWKPRRWRRSSAAPPCRSRRVHRKAAYWFGCGCSPTITEPSEETAPEPKKSLVPGVPSVW